MTGDAFADRWPGAGPSRMFEGCRRAAGRFMAGEGGRSGPPFEDIDGLIALGRMFKGGPFGGHGWGPHRRGGGRARRGDVRLALLLLLSEEPRNGYQLMQAIEERSEGRWRPSPGSVYPTLAQLEDEGLIHSREADASRVFELTDAGRAHLEGLAGEPAPWQQTEGEPDNPLAELAPLVIQIGKATFQVASVGTRAQRDRASAVLADTRRSLYRILAEDEDSEEHSDEA